MRTLVATTSSSRVRNFGQQPTGGHLAGSTRVDVGRVEEGDAALHGGPDDGLGRRLVEHPGPVGVVAEAHHAEAYPGDAQSGASEVDVLHGDLRGRFTRGFSPRERSWAHLRHFARGHLVPETPADRPYRVGKGPEPGHSYGSPRWGLSGTYVRMMGWVAGNPWSAAISDPAVALHVARPPNVDEVQVPEKAGARRSRRKWWIIAAVVVVLAGAGAATWFGHPEQLECRSRHHHHHHRCRR